MTTGEVSGGYTLGLADPYPLSGKVSIKNIDLDPLPAHRFASEGIQWPMQMQTVTFR